MLYRSYFRTMALVFVRRNSWSCFIGCIIIVWIMFTVSMTRLLGSDNKVNPQKQKLLASIDQLAQKNMQLRKRVDELRLRIYC